MSDDELVEKVCGGLAATCALDIAGYGGATLEEVGEARGIGKERARQLEEIGLRKINDRQRVAVVVLGEFRRVDMRVGRKVSGDGRLAWVESDYDGFNEL
jgi:hypothetical protein